MAGNFRKERSKFRQRVQEDGEGISEYAKELEKLVQSCNYTNIDENITEQFIAGLKSNQIREYLEKQDNLSLKNGVDIAKAMENVVAPSNSSQGASANGGKRGGSKKFVFENGLKTDRLFQGGKNTFVANNVDPSTIVRRPEGAREQTASSSDDVEFIHKKEVEAKEVYCAQENLDIVNFVKESKPPKKDLGSSNDNEKNASG